MYFAVELPHTFAINLQLLGGVWILQMAPMLIGGLFSRWFDRYALLVGWLAGMAFGTIAAYKSASPTVSHWASSSDIELGHMVYIGLTAVIINLIIAVILTVVFRAANVPQGADETPAAPVHRRTRRRPGAYARGHRPGCRGSGRGLTLTTEVRALRPAGPRPGGLSAGRPTSVASGQGRPVTRRDWRQDWRPTDW